VGGDGPIGDYEEDGERSLDCGKEGGEKAGWGGVFCHREG